MAARPRVHQSERKAGPSSILTVVVLSNVRYPRSCANCSGSHLVLPSDEDKWLHAPGSPIRTLSGPPSIFSLCACDSDFSLGASQQPSTHAILFLEVHCSSLQGGCPMRIRPKSSCFAQLQLNPCFQSNLASPCVSCGAQSIARTQFNQMMCVAATC
jgi:hypothetical protein